MILTITKFDFEDFIKAATELIVDDMKTTRLLHAHDVAGLDVVPYQTRLYNTVFMLAGILEKDRTDELKDMYFSKLERVFDVDIYDEPKLFAIAKEILLFVNSYKKPESIFGIDLRQKQQK